MSIDPNAHEPCLDAELLAAFAEGTIARSDIPAVLAHLEHCETCMSAVEIAKEMSAAERIAPRRSIPWWMAAAAAVLVIAVAASFLLWRRSPVDRLVRLAPADARIIEARLSGGFRWAPYRGPERERESAADAQSLKLAGVAGDLVDDAAHDPNTRHAAGIALVLIDHPDDGIGLLRSAAVTSPNDARVWNDLAAAESAAALRFGRPSLYPQALADADHALRIDPNFAEALFNRALALEHLGLTQQARAAWERYLRADGTSPWAVEARQRLARIAPSTGAAQFREEQPRLERAVAANDRKNIDAIVDRFRPQARTFAEAEYLGRWGETQEDADLAVARGIGDALARISGEFLLRDAVAAIDRASPAQRAAIASAHAIYRRGRISYSRHQPAAAEPDLRRAAALFASANDPMSLVARYYAANTRFDQNDSGGARTELEALLREADAQPHYIALGAQIRWELALCWTFAADWNAVATLASRSATDFARLGEDKNRAAVLVLYANALLYSGQPDAAWQQWTNLFALENRAGSERTQNSLGDAALGEHRTGHSSSAAALLALAEDSARETKNDAALSGLLFFRAMLGMEDAEGAARQSMVVAQRIEDPGLRARAVADARFAAGAVALEKHAWNVAKDELSRAIEHYDASGAPLLVPEARLLRARAELQSGDAERAARDLEQGIELIEGKRAPIAGTVMSTSVYDAGCSLFRDAIRLSLDRGDAAAAFAYAERSRGTFAFGDDWRVVPVDALQQRLRGSGAAILEIAMLPAETVAFCITESQFDVTRARADANDLYAALIRPFEMQLASARELIVVADPPLHNLSPATLYDSARKRYLVEMMPVSSALSASSLRIVETPLPIETVMTIAMPTGGSTLALPESAAEAADIERMYRRALPRADATAAALRTHADVIHISGHTGRERGDDTPALLFDDAPVTWSAAAAMPIGHPILVLAACETLRAPESPRVRALSVGGGFLAAGASAVIGTLAPIADNDAGEIFRAVHRGLARGEAPAIAVRHAQLQSLAARSNAWRNVTLLVNTIARSRS